MSVNKPKNNYLSKSVITIDQNLGYSFNYDRIESSSIIRLSINLQNALIYGILQSILYITKNTNQKKTYRRIKLTKTNNSYTNHRRAS